MQCCKYDQEGIQKKRKCLLQAIIDSPLIYNTGIIKKGLKKKKKMFVPGNTR
jgi:hypothetical protein